MYKLIYHYIIIATVTLVLLLATTNHSMAAVDMFLKLTNIPGESLDAVHKNEIDVLAWSWGMAQTGTAIIGPGKPDIQDISFTKFVDAATPLLVTAGVAGKIIPSAVIIVRKAGTLQEFLKITFTNVMISSVSTGGSGGQDRLTENVSFSFEAFKLDYNPQKADGTLDPTISSSYNIKTGK